MFDESPSLGPSEMLCVEVHHVERKPTFLELFSALNPVIIEDTLYIDTFKIVARDRLSLQSLEEIVIQSGRNKNKNGYTNSIHMNPDLDKNNNPLRGQHVPFDQLRFRVKPKRPVNKSHHKHCRCCT